jgi:DNA-binding PadR family transcriptional regulator
MTLRELVRAAIAEGAVYGLAIVDHVKANPAARWWHKFALDGRIYPLLHRMEEQGEVVSSIESTPTEGTMCVRGGIPRRCYQLRELEGVT